MASPKRTVPGKKAISVMREEWHQRRIAELEEKIPDLEKKTIALEKQILDLKTKLKESEELLDMTSGMLTEAEKERDDLRDRLEGLARHIVSRPVVP